LCGAAYAPPVGVLALGGSDTASSWGSTGFWAANPMAQIAPRGSPSAFRGRGRYRGRARRGRREVRLVIQTPQTAHVASDAVVDDPHVHAGHK
jgi:hypothetical protein